MNYSLLENCTSSVKNQKILAHYVWTDFMDGLENHTVLINREIYKMRK